MYAPSFQLDQEYKPSYAYTGKLIGFVLGELNLFFLMFPFAEFFVTFGKWINLTSVTNAIGQVLALLSLAYLFFAAKTFTFKWSRTIAMFMFVLLIMLSFTWTDPWMKAETKNIILRTVLTVAQTLVIVKIFFEKGNEYVLDVLKRYAIIIGIMSGLSIALFPAESSWTVDDTGRKQAFFSSPNNLGQFLSFFFLILNFYKRKSLSTPVWLLLNGLIVYQAIECDSKTSMTGGIICFILFNFRFLIRPFLIFVVCAGLYLPYYTQTFEKGEAEKIEFAKRDMTFTGRSDVWHVMLLDLREQKRQLLGFGTGGYWGEKNYNPRASIHELDWTPNSGHNGYLDTKVTLGWVGVICLLFFLAQYFTNIFRVLSNKNIVMLFVSIVFCINNITETSYFRGKHFFFVLLMCFFWYTCFKSREATLKDREEGEDGETEEEAVEEPIRRPVPVPVPLQQRY